MCIDYRELSKIDLYSGCHQMRVHEDKIPRIAFRKRYGHFELTVMPFGLTNAPTVFMELMSRVEHESHLKMNLELLKKEKCYVKPNKVEAEDNGWSDLGVVIARPSTILERANVVVDAWSRKGRVKSRRVRDICRTIQAKEINKARGARDTLVVVILEVNCIKDLVALHSGKMFVFELESLYNLTMNNPINGYITDSDPEEDEEDPKEDPADYHVDGGDNDDNESSDDDDDDDDVEKDKEDKEHLAPADPFVVLIDDLVPSS
nr:reverse transcriptase [Tanacetum cinerariifolium]